MAKVFAKIVIICLPIFFVIFSLIYAFHGFTGDFAPSYADVMSRLASFPDIATQWRALDIVNSSGLIVGPLQPLTYLGYILSVPIQVVGWFFSVIFA